MFALLVAALLTIAVTSETSSTSSTTEQCEAFEVKLANIDTTSDLTRDDPCFGYGVNCCGIYSDFCYWKDTTWCSRCARGYIDSCPACCDSYNTTTIEPETPTPTGAPTTIPSAVPTFQPTREPTDKPSLAPSSDPTRSPTFIPSDVPTDQPTPEPTSSPTVIEVVATPAPTAHSAKKWSMLHPKYKGGDGELLWNIYYGDLSTDERFDSFRADQLWDADVIRPIIEADIKYERFQLANIGVHNPHRQSSHHWSGSMKVLFVSLSMFTVALLVYCLKCSEHSKIEDSSEIQALLS